MLNLKTQVHQLRIAYEDLAINLGNFKPPESKNEDVMQSSFSRAGSNKKNTDADKILMQAYHIDKNSYFIQNDLKSIIDRERDQQFPDQALLQSYYHLKTVLGNNDCFQVFKAYAKSLESVISRSKMIGGDTIKRICKGLEPVIKKEEEMLGFVDQLRTHTENLEGLLDSNKLTGMCEEATIKRLELEKNIVDISEFLVSGVRGLNAAYLTFHSSSNSSQAANQVLDLLDEDQLNLLEQTFGLSLQQLDQAKSRAGSYRQLPSTCNIQRSLQQISDFGHGLFTEIGLSSTQLSDCLGYIKNYLKAFLPLEKSFDKLDSSLLRSRNESALTNQLLEFLKDFNKLGPAFELAQNDLALLRRVVARGGIEEFLASFDFMAMVKEIVELFSKILDARVRNGQASAGLYEELKEVENDKPEELIRFINKFKTNFS